MAFTTISGSGAAADSFVGTSGADSLALANTDGNILVTAEGGADIVTLLNSGSALYGGVVTNASLKGGDGGDTFTLGTAGNATVFTSGFVNGNAGNDTITSQAADTYAGSTVLGGAGNDTMALGVLTSSFSNGNLGNDTITINGATTSSTLHGGAGNDAITDGNVATTSSLISADKGNDTVTLGNGGASVDATTIKGGDGVDTITLGNAGQAANDDIFIAGNDGADTLTGTTVAVAEITLSGGAGNDTITSGAGSTTAIGGLGRDTMVAGANTNTFQYTAVGQGGAAASATSTEALALGDVIGTGTAFVTTTDKISIVSADALVGSASSVATGAANAWNLNTAGVFVSTGQLAWTAGTTTAATVATAIGTVVGDAGDTAYFVIEDDTTAINTIMFQLTLGTTRSTTGALNAGDTISVVADVTGDDELVTGDFTFA